MLNDNFLKIVRRLPTDYKDYGGEVERWDHPEETYPDCSTGCVFFKRLVHEDGRPDPDWGICLNPHSPRVGMLTFEHQAGFTCFKS